MITLLPIQFCSGLGETDWSGFKSILALMESLSSDAGFEATEHDICEYILEMGSYPPAALHRVRELLRRPPIEPAVMRLVSGELDAAALIDTARTVTGNHAILERGERSWGNAKVIYPPSAGLDRLIDVYHDHLRRNGPADTAAWIFFYTIVDHPLTDGNGRLARALFQMTLIAGGVLSRPVFPLGPLVNLDQTTHTRTVMQVSMENDWISGQHYFLQLANVAINMTIGAINA